MPSHDTTPSTFRLILTPERPALIAGKANTLRVLVRVQAPDLPLGVAGRDPLHLALVLDRSGSMSGEPLEEAKRCARHIVDHLAPGDRAGIIAFDDEVQQVAALTSATEKAVLHAAINAIDLGGSTNLQGGWRAGADELAAHLASQGVHRVILLSDGVANVGVADLEAITMGCRDLARAGVTTSTYGLGREFNEDLMLAMSKAGRGNAYYGQTAADLAEPFAAEFDLLTHLCARGLVLKVNAPEAINVSMRNDYDPDAEDRCTWRIPDLAYAAEAWALIELALPAGEYIAGQSLDLPVTVSIQASGPDSAPVFLMATLPTLSLIAPADLASIAADELVARRLLEVEAAELLVELRAAMLASDWTGARAILERAETHFASHEWAASIVATMRRLVAQRDAHLAAKEAMYSGRRMSSRLAMRDERLCLEDDQTVPAYLRRKSEQGKGTPRRGNPGRF